MKHFLTFVTLIYWIMPIYGQVDSTKITNIDIAEDVENPLVLVFHSMGDVSVKGYEGNKLFVYAQETLPSINDLLNQNKEDVFTYMNKYSNSPIKVKRNSSFTIQQQDSVIQVETNVFSFNSNIFVLTPNRSSVVVTVNDMGSIFMENLHGDVEANTGTGDILIRNTNGAISAGTDYGNVITDLRNKEESHPLFLSTFLGNIEVILPQTVLSTVSVSSEMGTLYSNFEEVNAATLQANANSPIQNRKLSFKLNGGGTEFVIKTFKGDIYLRHVNDQDK